MNQEATNKAKSFLLDKAQKFACGELEGLAYVPQVKALPDDIHLQLSRIIMTLPEDLWHKMRKGQLTMEDLAAM
jgi:hypothetical protein